MKSVHRNNNTRDGYFQYLQAHVGASFDRNVATFGIFSKDFHDGGICFYTEEETERVRKANFKGKTTDKKKFIQIILV